MEINVTNYPSFPQSIDILTGKERVQSIDRLQIIFKVVERCNINCSYCYYFNMGDESALSRPSIVSFDNAISIAIWIAKGCVELNIKNVDISFHGGEPMLLPIKRFKSICKILNDAISKFAHLTLSIQTNGTILNKDWIEIFEEYEINVGFSIDGYREANDRYRLNKDGSSTFDIIVKNILTINSSKSLSSKLKLSTISVIDPMNDYHKVYKFLRSLGIIEMSFLLPDNNVDTLTDKNFIDGCGRAMFDVFEEWLIEDNPEVTIRHIEDVLPFYNIHVSRSPAQKASKNQILVAQSNGKIAVNDSFIPALNWYRTTPEINTKEKIMLEFLHDSVFDEIEYIINSPSKECFSCKWLKVCGGGDMENRFSTKDGFNNPSIYCNAYKIYYQSLEKLLVKNKFPIALLPFGDN
ncbi:MULTISPECIES: radical SAM protein [unclassified Colwellia]|jgi:uncharacterized protein|uniref:radical SAM protein n=1 Tax=unclassified Colwellia TaxID=196834 RepID=UPI0015F67BC2|nr:MULTISPECIES: radical SAM protein [unclassified Colwellia]MBA6256432.1 radical SAM protein [Colwellia sp. MB3u-28]MBA6260365.1 radical SAM protein [Colwellia sp. MB3u-41]